VPHSWFGNMFDLASYVYLHLRLLKKAAQGGLVHSVSKIKKKKGKCHYVEMETYICKNLRVIGYI
jgi:hypothetical protein